MNKLGFKMKVLLMLGTALAALLFMAVTALLQERSLIIESRREQLATAVQSAHSIVAAYQAKAASGAIRPGPCADLRGSGFVICTFRRWS